MLELLPLQQPMQAQDGLDIFLKHARFDNIQAHGVLLACTSIAQQLENAISQVHVLNHCAGC